MPWEKNFDHNSVLDRAMMLFWERGYRGVSMADLVEELGINRSSLYSTFGQKEDLFVQALVRYDTTHRQGWLDDLARRSDPVDSIRQVFAEVAAAPEATRRLGCLLVNTTLEFPAKSPRSAALVRQAFLSTQQFFEEQLLRARQADQLDPAIDVAGLATALLALFLGMRVLARAERPPETIQPILRQVDILLRGADLGTGSIAEW